MGIGLVSGPSARRLSVSFTIFRTALAASKMLDRVSINRKGARAGAQEMKRVLRRAECSPASRARSPPSSARRYLPPENFTPSARSFAPARDTSGGSVFLFRLYCLFRFLPYLFSRRDSKNRVRLSSRRYTFRILALRHKVCWIIQKVQ